MQRIFIVGTARSGTTLLQSIIANHPAVFTLPETHFLPYSIPKNKLLRVFHKVKHDQVSKLKSLFTEMGLGEGFQPQERDLKNLSAWTQYFLKFIDELASEHGKEVWLEKTPMHLHYIDLIKKNCANCFFIHTQREPKANIAALYDVSKKHPGAFKQASLEKAIKRYKSDTLESQKYLGMKSHIHIYYEDLLNIPESQTEIILQFLKLENAELLKDFQNKADSIILKDESWKENNRKEIKATDKISERLSEEEIELLEDSLRDFKPKLLERYENRTN